MNVSFVCALCILHLKWRTTNIAVSARHFLNAEFSAHHSQMLIDQNRISLLQLQFSVQPTSHCTWHHSEFDLYQFLPRRWLMTSLRHAHSSLWTQFDTIEMTSNVACTCTMCIRGLAIIKFPVLFVCDNNLTCRLNRTANMNRDEHEQHYAVRIRWLLRFDSQNSQSMRQMSVR